jgi:hypothetical protein
VAPDRWAGRGRAAGKKALAGTACVAVAPLLVAAAGSASSHRRVHPAADITAVQSVAVGPKGSAVADPVTNPAPPGGASQVVSGVAASTSAVRFSAAARPVYYGTEPGTMTLARRGHQLVVTVVPR